MGESWRAVVEQLAGSDADLEEGVSTEFDGIYIARVVIPGALLTGRGSNSEGALESLAHALGDLRLMQSLETAGWILFEEVIDEATYVVARDPGGTVWAIGVASDEYRRGYLEPDMRRDDRVEHLAFIDPIATRSSEALMAALAEEI